jgi:hypothetical protein
MLNTVLPGSGLLLRHPGIWILLPALLGAIGLSLVVIALVTPGSAVTVQIGWSGLIIWMSAVVVSSSAWALLERPSSRDLSAIQPLFRDVAKAYLTNDLIAAEQVARRLVALAGAEPGAWRLLALISRAQGQTTRAAKCERTAARLDLTGMRGNQRSKPG